MSSLLFPLTIDPRKKKRRRKRNYNKNNPFYGRWYSKSNYRNYAKTGRQSNYAEMMADLGAYDAAKNMAERRYEQQQQYQRQKDETQYYANLHKNIKLLRMSQRNAESPPHQADMIPGRNIHGPYLNKEEFDQISGSYLENKKIPEVVVTRSTLGNAVRRGQQLWDLTGHALTTARDVQRLDKSLDNLREMNVLANRWYPRKSHVSTNTLTGLPDRTNEKTQVDVQKLKQNALPVEGEGPRESSMLRQMNNAVTTAEFDEIDQTPIRPITENQFSNEIVQQEINETTEQPDTNAQNQDVLPAQLPASNYAGIQTDRIPWEDISEDADIYFRVARFLFQHTDDHNGNAYNALAKAMSNYNDDLYDQNLPKDDPRITQSYRVLDRLFRDFLIDMSLPNREHFNDNIGTLADIIYPTRDIADSTPTPLPLPTSQPITTPSSTNIQLRGSNRIYHDGSSFRNPRTILQRARERFGSTATSPEALRERLINNERTCLAKLLDAQSYVNPDLQAIFRDVEIGNPNLQRNENNGAFLKKGDLNYGYMSDAFKESVKKYIPFDYRDRFYKFNKAYTAWMYARDDLSLLKHLYPEVYFHNDIAAAQAHRQKWNAQMDAVNNRGNLFYRNHILPAQKKSIEVTNPFTNKISKRNAYIAHLTVPESQREKQLKITGFTEDPELPYFLDYYQNKARQLAIADDYTPAKKMNAIVDVGKNSYDTINHIIYALKDLQSSYDKPNWLSDWLDKEGAMPVNIHIHDYLPALSIYHTMLKQMEDVAIDLNKQGYQYAPNIDDMVIWINSYMSHMAIQWQNVWEQKGWTNPYTVLNRLRSLRWWWSSWKDEPVKTLDDDERNRGRLLDPDWQNKFNFTDPKTGFNYRTAPDISKLNLSYYENGGWNNNRYLTGWLNMYGDYHYWPENITYFHKLNRRNPNPETMPIYFEHFAGSRNDYKTAKYLMKKRNNTRIRFPKYKHTIMKKYPIYDKKPWYKRWYNTAERYTNSLIDRANNF